MRRRPGSKQSPVFRVSMFVSLGTRDSLAVVLCCCLSLKKVFYDKPNGFRLDQKKRKIMEVL